MLPVKYREQITKPALEEAAAYLGAKKTGDVIRQYFFWLDMVSDINNFL